MGRTADYSKERCSVAATLEVVGDPWTLLILRDAFRGVRRFDQWQESLGVARNVLAARLKSLVAHGVLEKNRYSEHPPRFEYRLTEKGKDLRPVLITLSDWGDRHVYGENGPLHFVHEPCGHKLRPGLICMDCGEPVEPRSLRMVHNPESQTVGEALAEQELADLEAEAS